MWWVLTFKCSRWRSQSWVCDSNDLNMFAGIEMCLHSEGTICLYGHRWTEFLWCPSVLTPVLHTHTHTFHSEGAQFQILSLLHCYTNRLAGAWGQFAIGVCVCAHTHSFDRHVCHSPCRDVGMWKSLGDVSSYVPLCPLFVVHKAKRSAFESHSKCTPCLNCCKSTVFRKVTLTPP